MGLFNILKRLSGGRTAKPEHTVSLTPAYTDLTLNKLRRNSEQPPVKPKRTARFSAEFIQNQTRLDFDLPEALRLRSLGWGNRRIARQMNNVGKDTVRKRLQEYDDAHPKPVVPPKAPPVTSPQPPHDKPATFPNKPEPTPTVTLTVPEPVTNLAELAAVRKSRYGDGFPPDLTHIFIVRPEHVKFGLGSEQPVIGFDCWRSDYRGLEMFQTPVKFYVLVNAADGAAINRAWLDGLASDVWFRERAVVHRIERGSVQAVFQSRYSAKHQYPAQAFGKALADDTFERGLKFVPCPQHNHVLELDALTGDAVPYAAPQAVSQYETGWSASQAIPPQQRYYADDYPRQQEAAGGLAGQDDGTNYGK